MIDWHDDLTDAPRQNREEILIVLKGEKRVRVTCWVWQDYRQLEGGWLGVRPDETVEHWARINYPFVKSAAPAPSVPALPPGLSVPVALPPGLPQSSNE